MLKRCLQIPLVSAHLRSQGRLGLAGFVWLQGFNDLVDGQTYPNGDYDEYSAVGTFIRDVRNDLSAPKMPLSSVYSC